MFFTIALVVHAVKQYYRFRTLFLRFEIALWLQKNALVCDETRAFANGFYNVSVVYLCMGILMALTVYLLTASSTSSSWAGVKDKARFVT